MEDWFNEFAKLKSINSLLDVIIIVVASKKSTVFISTE